MVTFRCPHAYTYMNTHTRTNQNVQMYCYCVYCIKREVNTCVLQSGVIESRGVKKGQVEDPHNPIRRFRQMKVLVKTTTLKTRH